MLLHVLESIVLKLMHDGSGHVSGEHRLTTHPCAEYVYRTKGIRKHFNTCTDSVYDTMEVNL